MYSAILESVIQEFSYNQIMKKQSSIGRLFPTFPQRVRAVAARGGVTLLGKMPETWHFSVPSVTAAAKEGNPNIRYDVYVRFLNLPEVIKRFAPQRDLWNKDMTAPDYRKLASEMMNKLDIETDCSCPADLYWGGEYIKTQRKAQYGDQENRPPDIKNPNQYGALCKHGELVFEVLPMYVTTFASFLKQFWSKEIEAAAQASTRPLTGAQKAALAAREEQRQRSKAKAPREYAEEANPLKQGEVPVAEPESEEGEDLASATPVKSGELGGEPEEPPSRTGKQTTKGSTKFDTKTKTGQKSSKPGTNPVAKGNISATRSNNKRGTK